MARRAIGIGRETVLVGTVGILIGACYEADSSPRFSDRVELSVVSEMQLEETLGRQLQEIRGFDLSGDGTLALITDSRATAVSLYDVATGDLLLRRTFSGQLSKPRAAVYSEGGILVPDGEPRVTLLNADDLSVIRMMPLDQKVPTTSVSPRASSFIVTNVDTHYPGDSFVEYSLDGEKIGSFHELPDHALTPFWGEFTTEHLARSSDGDFVASSMSYPLQRYSDGERLEFGSPPPGYREPRRPERFEFGGGPDGRKRYEEFARSFTTISSVWTVADSLLVVEHMDLDPTENAVRSPSFSIDVYDTHSLEKVASGVALPGPIVYAASTIRVVTVRPPAGPWTVTEFSLIGIQ